MHFKPSITLTLTLITLAGIFLRLGLWQLDRKAEKAELFDRFENAPTMSVERALAEQAELARVEAFGHYDPTRHVLLDNRIWNGRPGVHALTPFRLADGSWVLVNRGWLPLPPDRLRLPAVPTDAAPRTIRGRLVAPGTDGARLGEADVLLSDTWPQLVTYLELPDVGAALGESLQPWIVQLDAEDPSGFAGRRWSAAVMAPAVHGAYAVQWLALCATALIIWFTLGWRRGSQLARQTQNTPGPDKTGDENT